MLAFLGNIGPVELVLIAVLAVLIFGKDLPQAASKAYLQARKLRNAVDDLRRDSGIERELRDIERTVREAEWEARKADGVRTKHSVARNALPAAPPEAVPADPPTPSAGPDSSPPAPDQPVVPTDPEPQEPGLAKDEAS